MHTMHLISVFNKLSLTAVLIATSSLIELSSQSTEFTIKPGNISVPLHLMINVTFHCSLSDPALRSHWIVKFPDIMQNLSTRDVNDMVILIERGVDFRSSRIITIPGVVENNCTLIRCAVFKSSSGSTEFSDPVKLTIVGPPLPPDPVLVILCASQLEIQWEVPYSPDNFTVDSYNIEVVNATSGDVLHDIMQQNETSHRLVLDGIDQVTSCHLLTVSVTAVSVVGESEPGMVSGGFPIAPQPFQSEVDVELTFHRDGSPIVEVSFEAPLICDFQTSNYTITIEDTGLPLLTRQSTYTGNSRSIVEVFDSGLQANRNYTVTVSVEDEYFDGVVLSNTTKFSTTFEPTAGGSPGLGLNDIGTYTGAGGGILIVILVAVTLVVTTLICSRKRKNHTAPGATMDKMLNNSNRADQLDNDPFALPPESDPTRQGSVYETISEYQEAKKNTMLSRQQQDHQWKLQQLEFIESERKALEDSAYQVMSSTNIRDVPDSAGITTTSHFPYPQPYPTSTQSHNNPNPLMMPQQPAVSDYDNNYPYPYNSGYQFRPCPASAAAGATLSPIHESHYDNDAGGHGQFYHSHGLDSQPTMTELDVEPDLGMDEEEEQDYTFMSQAGTLTSQTSRTAPYSYTDDGHHSVDTTPKHCYNVNVDKNAGPSVTYTTSRDSEC